MYYMHKAISRIILLFFLSLQTISVLAQPGRDLSTLNKSAGSENNKVVEIEPKIGLWNLTENGAFKDSIQLDTLQDYIHIFHPLYKEVITASFVGNYATPAIDNNFFNRQNQTNYFFAESRQWYILTPEKLKYFNTHTPYSRMDYTQSENKSKNNETRFNVIHSQNINPWWNATFRVDLAKSDGQYVSQETRNNSIAAYSSYNKDYLNIHAGFINNSVRNYENGGLTSDSLLFEQQDARYWNVNLNSSQSRFRNSYFFANGEYRFGKFVNTGEDEEEQFRPILGIIYSGELSLNKQEFNEEEDEDNDFFEDTYYPESYTKDSIRYNQISNVIQIKQYENADKKFSFGKRAFLGYELVRGSMPGEVQGDTTVLRTDIKFANSYVGGGIFRETGRFWKWNFMGKLYFAGRNAGQTELSGIIYKPFVFLRDSLASISFDGKIENIVPDYFQEEFYSNHYQWKQNLSMEQRMTAGATFRMPKRKLELGAKYAIINNFLYNDTLGIPNQTSNEILVLSAYIDKDFNYRNLHLRTRLLWQKASNEEYLHLPQLSAFVSAYFQFTISKVLLTQIGSDVRYNTKYYADAYAPSTGLFYLQHEKEYGNYPYIDVYASLRLKRTRVFFKYMNVGTNFLSGEYMTTPHYPMNRATFRLGLSWAFYD